MNDLSLADQTVEPHASPSQTGPNSSADRRPGRFVARIRTWFAAVIAAALIATPALSDPVGRFEMQPGDTCLAQIARPGEFHEYVVNLARGSRLTLNLGKASPGSCDPVAGFLDANYNPIPVLATSFTSVGTAFPAERSEAVRAIVTGRNRTVGGYRVTGRVRAQKKFKLKGKPPKSAEDPPPPHTLVFGAYPGFTFTVKVKSKSATPATVASVVGPDGVELIPSVVSKRRRTGRGKRATADVPVYTVTTFGDHWVRLNVPVDSKRWTADVSLKTAFPKREPHDLRPQVVRPSPLTIVPSGSLPLVQINGERGGPNSFGILAELGRPQAVFADRRTGGCVRATTEVQEFPFTYDLRCTNGYIAQITDAFRDPDGELRNFLIPTLRDPFGTGSGEIRNIVYDFLGKPESWTEIRHFDGSGRTHTLEFFGLQRYSHRDAEFIQPKQFQLEGQLKVDESILAGTSFSDVLEDESVAFLNTVFKVGDALRFVRDPDELVGPHGAIVSRNVRDIRIVEKEFGTLTLAEPLVAETPPPGRCFQYFIVRRSVFVRSFSVRHTDPDGVITTVHNAGGRIP